MNSLWERIGNATKTVDFEVQSWNLTPGNAIKVPIRASDNPSVIKAKCPPNSRLESCR